MFLLRIFKNNRTGGVAGLIILSLAIFSYSFMKNTEVLAYSGMPFYNHIFGQIHTIPVLNRIIALGLVLLICYTLNRIGVRFVLLETRSFMPGYFFLLFTLALPESQLVSPALVGSLFYLFCFAILFNVHEQRPDSFNIFMASVVLALGSMFYLKLVWFVPLIWLSLATLRSVTWRELFFPVIAYLLLTLFLFTWYWAVLDNGQAFTELVSQNLAFEGSFKPQHFSVYILYGFLVLLVILASIYMVNRFQARKTVIQNIYQVLFYMFVAGSLFIILVTKYDPTNLGYIGIPISFILTNYFHRKRNHWMHELALWIVVGLIVFVHWFT